MPDLLGSCYVEIAARADKLLAQLQDIERKTREAGDKMEKNLNVPTDRLQGGLSKVGDGLSTVMTRFAGVAGAVMLAKKAWDFLVDSFEQFEKRSKALLGVDATIHSMGLESRYTSDGLLKMANSLMVFNKYAVTANEVLDLSGFLMTFEHISKETLPRATQVVIDLAKKMQVDLKSAALSVGIALDNPAEGLMRLSRSGIRFSRDEVEVIKALVDTGKAAEAQEVLFDKLEKKVGGAAAAMQTSWDVVTGSVGNMTGAITRLIGSMVEKVIVPAGESFADLIGIFQTTVDLKNLDSLDKKIEAINKKLATGPTFAQQFLRELGAFVLKPLGLGVGSEWTDPEKARMIAERDALQKRREEQGKPFVPPTPAAKPVVDTTKQQLDAHQKYLKALDELNEAYYKDEFNRKQKEIADTYEQDLREIANKRKLSTKEAPYSAKAETEDRLTAETKYTTANILNTRAREEAEEKAITAVREMREKYVAEQEKLDHDLVDVQIRGYTLTQKAFEKVLQDQLAAKVAQWIEWNAKAEEFNRQHPGANIPMIDIGAQQAGQQGEITEQGKEYGRGKKEKDLENWKKDNEAMAKVAETMVSSIDNVWGSALDNWIVQGQSFGSAMTGIFKNMANQIISQLIRIGTQALLLNIIKSLAKVASVVEFGPLGLAGHSGGVFEGGRKMAVGGSFIVPGGYQNDTFPLMVESGERVTVTPAGRAADEGAGYREMLRKLDILNMNLGGRNKVSGSIAVQVGGAIQGQDIYLSNKKSGRIYTRIR